MTDAAPIDRLQKIADYRTTFKNLRKFGKVLIIFGLVALLLGAIGFEGSLSDIKLMSFSANAVALGFWARLCPTTFGANCDGFYGFLIGVCSLYVLFSELIPEQRIGEPSKSLIALGVSVLIIGVFRLNPRRARIGNRFREPPTDEQLMWFDDLAAEILSTPTAEDEDMVEFNHLLPWKGKKMGHMVVFVSKSDAENLVVDRHDMGIEVTGKALFSKTRIVKMRIGARRFSTAKIAPDMLARLESWRIETAAEEQIDQDRSDTE